jgi:hypothetical protein
LSACDCLGAAKVKSSGQHIFVEAFLDLPCNFLEIPLIETGRLIAPN